MPNAITLKMRFIFYKKNFQRFHLIFINYKLNILQKNTRILEIGH